MLLQKTKHGEGEVGNSSVFHFHRDSWPSHERERWLPKPK